MSEMVERVAKAIWEYGSSVERPRWYDFLHHRKRDEYRGIARAAIAAMREPTDRMRHYGWEAIERADKDVVASRHYGWEAIERADKDIVASECWRAMIDAALKE